MVERYYERFVREGAELGTGLGRHDARPWRINRRYFLATPVMKTTIPSKNFPAATSDQMCHSG